MGLMRVLKVAIVVGCFASILEARHRQHDSPQSAVSYAFCENFNPETVEFNVIVQPNSRPGEPTKPALTASFSHKTTNKKDTKSLSGTIDQLLGVKDVQVTSASMSELCLEVLVVDVNIICDTKTHFKTSCGRRRSSTRTVAQSTVAVLPCKSFGSRLTPAFVCPQALTKLLKTKGVISNTAEVDNPQTEGKPPVYNIIEDMTQASLVIADGVVEGSRVVFERRAEANLMGATSSSGSKKWASFLSSLGPVLNSFGGLTTIITTFLTPNPFDELASYMKEQFVIVQNQLDDIQNDIQNLELVVESQSQKTAMATALRTTRHTVERYRRMLSALSRAQVCDPQAVLAKGDVVDFMAAVKRDSFRYLLQDLLVVDFGGVIEASTGLLRPLMRAYCQSNPTRVNIFMQHAAMYAYGGTVALFAYDNLKCLQNEDSCTHLQSEREDWLRKLYKFTSKAKVYEVATTPGESMLKGFELDTRDDLEKIIQDELKKVPSPSPPFPGLFEKVNTFIINKLKNQHDWPYTCIVKPLLDNRKLVILGVAQIDASVFGTSFKPWALFNRNMLKKVKYRKELPSGYSKTRFEAAWVGSVWEVRERNGGNEAYVEDSSSQSGYVFRPWQLNNVPPSGEPRDRALYFLFNPENFKTKTGTQKVIGNLVPIDAYFMSGENLSANGLTDPTIGCWEASRSYGWPFSYQCQAPDSNDPDRAKSSKERYVALVGE